jgi:hypothetical protein
MDPWGETVESTIPPLIEAFPGIAAEAVRLREAFVAGEIDLRYCVGALVEGREDGIIEIASYLGFQPIVLKFILGQMLKPFVEKRTERVRPLIENLPWRPCAAPAATPDKVLAALAEAKE